MLFMRRNNFIQDRIANNCQGEITCDSMMGYVFEKVEKSMKEMEIMLFTIFFFPPFLQCFKKPSDSKSLKHVDVR